MLSVVLKSSLTDGTAGKKRCRDNGISVVIAAKTIRKTGPVLKVLGLGNGIITNFIALPMDHLDPRLFRFQEGFRGAGQPLDMLPPLFRDLAGTDLCP